jgi:CRISPR-associated protein Cas1
MQMVLNTKGLRLEKHRGMFLVTPLTGEPRTISPRKLTSIAITQEVWVSSSAIELAASHEIPILLHHANGKVIARLSAPNFSSIASLRREQLRFVEHSEAGRWIIGLYLLKTQQQQINLRRLDPSSPAASQIEEQKAKFEHVATLPFADAAPKIMQTEAVIARYYWKELAQLIPAFEKRTRRPAQDSFNAALNYLYGMLYTVVENSLFAVGLDPHIGILHADEYNKPVLAFDFIEPFRPLVDWLLIASYQTGNLQAAHFSKLKDGVFLNQAGKAFFIPLFNQWLRTEGSWGGRSASPKSHIYKLSGHFAQKLRVLAQIS